MSYSNVIDGRYTAELEHCGQSEPRHIARFCGEWISHHKTKRGAEQACVKHNFHRLHPEAKANDSR